MSQAGTLLSDLGNAPPGGSDGDLVNQILADMNGGAGQLQNPIVQSSQPQMQMAMPPPMGNRMPMQQAPPVPQIYPQATDPSVANAHLIGRDYPTPADFQAMMMAGAPYQPPAPVMMAAPQPPPPTKNWVGQWADEFKLPLLVAICTLLVTLPAVNLLVSHYAPRLLRPGGDLNLGGLVLRALLAGALFWFLQRVVAPLVAL